MILLMQRNVEDFLSAFDRSFTSTKKIKVQEYIELANYQPSEIIELESKRFWLTNVFICRFFNQYVKGEIRSDFLKRVIVNGMTGSSWKFKRFDSLSIIFTVADKKRFSTFQLKK